MTHEHQDIASCVQSLYDRQPQREWERLDRHRTEFAVTLHTLQAHLPPPPARILDCGGGPGRYAVELSRLGHTVTLFDLSAGCLDLAKAKAQEAGVKLQAREQGTAIDLARFANEEFDAVLLMGPLYHLLEENERFQALQESYRVVKPGGLCFAAFITRFAAVRYAAVEAPTLPIDTPEELETILSSGRLPPRGEQGSRFVAHFVHPAEVTALCRQPGFEVLEVLGVEGVVSMIEEGVNALQGKAWQTWVELNQRLAPEPSLLGAAEHLLVVLEKPLWKAVLKEVAQRLARAGISYKVVGGTSAALQGISVPVKDIDIETNAEDAYRAQALFSDHVVEPISLRESSYYRSHFGWLEFGPCRVEIMGDLYRRDQGEERWIPSAARTSTNVNLEGVPVCASWLEEETLAYIRRGRLKRAAQCLPHCDRGRIMQLLRGEVLTDLL
jgi:S-adenosylmethionine-dependent methyltransferase